MAPAKPPTAPRYAGLTVLRGCARACRCRRRSLLPWLGLLLYTQADERKVGHRPRQRRCAAAHQDRAPATRRRRSRLPVRCDCIAQLLVLRGPDPATCMHSSCNFSAARTRCTLISDGPHAEGNAGAECDSAAAHPGQPSLSHPSTSKLRLMCRFAIGLNQSVASRGNRRSITRIRS